jgi:hypothetical protein
LIAFLGALLLSRVASTVFSCALIGCFSFAKAELKALSHDIHFGLVDVRDGLIPLSWTIVNNGSSELKLIRINLCYPHTTAALTVGIIAPGASTAIHGNFDPQNTIGPIYGTLEVVAERGPTLTLTFQGKVKCDIEPITELKTVINDISSKTTVIEAKPLIFTTRSGLPLIASRIAISGEPFIGAHMAVNNDRLELIPYIYEPSLPNHQSGNTVLKLSFKYDIGNLTFDIPISWERKDPLCVINMGSGAYAVTYDDNRPFQVRSLTVNSGISYTTQFSDDGCTLFLRPVPKPEIVITRIVTSYRHNVNSKYQHNIKSKIVKGSKQSMTVKKQRLGTKLKLRQSHPILTKVSPKVRLRAKSDPKVSTEVKSKSQAKLKTKLQNRSQIESNVITKGSVPRLLIRLETTHPYRGEVVIGE